MDRAFFFNTQYLVQKKKRLEFGIIDPSDFDPNHTHAPLVNVGKK